MNDLIEKLGTKSSHVVNFGTAAGFLITFFGGVWAFLSGYFSLPSEVQKIREETKALREIVISQQSRIDSGLRGPQGERGPQGPPGPIGERGQQGQKGDTGTTNDAGRILSTAQITALIDARMAETGRQIVQPSPNVQFKTNLPTSGIKPQSDGCYVLPTRQVNINVKIISGAKFCNENRSKSLDVFAIEPSRNRIHIQYGTNQYVCEMGSRCNFNELTSEYLYRIEGFENNGSVASLIFYRP